MFAGTLRPLRPHRRPEVVREIVVGVIVPLVERPVDDVRLGVVVRRTDGDTLVDVHAGRDAPDPHAHPADNTAHRRWADGWWSDGRLAGPTRDAGLGVNRHRQAKTRAHAHNYREPGGNVRSGHSCSFPLWQVTPGKSPSGRSLADVSAVNRDAPAAFL